MKQNWTLGEKNLEVQKKWKMIDIKCDHDGDFGTR